MDDSKICENYGVRVDFRTISICGSARPFDPSVSNLQTRRELTSRYDSQQSESYWSRSYSSYGRSWRGGGGGGGGSQGQQRVAESGIDFYWFIGFFVIVVSLWMLISLYGSQVLEMGLFYSQVRKASPLLVKEIKSIQSWYPRTVLVDSQIVDAAVETPMTRKSPRAHRMKLYMFVQLIANLPMTDWSSGLISFCLKMHCMIYSVQDVESECSLVNGNVSWVPLSLSESKWVLISAPDKKQSQSADFSPALGSENFRGGHGEQSLEHLCTVCLDAPKDSFFDPCGHPCTCYSCGMRIQNGDIARRPICQENVLAVRRIYDS
ncbi:unnamed protein product [Sphagnum jensenii]|uniref:Uncharacterized protein n=1 Tax=Sphagnum jensenii TaxID=128206 RepID=A0ABP1C065_9BRYO